MTITHSFASCPVVELRRYTLHPHGLRDLSRLFDQQFIEPQEDAGMVVGGTFIDEDDPDSFTWLRGFPDHRARTHALEAFYGGPVWARHRDAANATMVDSDDVLLLRPTQPAHGPATAVPRGLPGDQPRPERILVGTYGLAALVHGPAADAARATDADEYWFATNGHLALEMVLGVRVATWRTDPNMNGFPRLPVREDRVLAWLAVFPDADKRDDAAARLATAEIGMELNRRARWSRRWRLAPTARSAHPAG